MNYRKLCKSLLDRLYESLVPWFCALQEIRDHLRDDQNQEEKKSLDDLHDQGLIWIEQLDNIRCDLSNSEAQDEEQEPRLLCSQLCDLISEISSLEVTKANQIAQDSQYDRVLKDLGAQLEYKEGELQDLKQFITDSNELLDKLAEETREKENKRDRLTNETEKIYNQSKKLEKEIAAKGEYSKKLDEEILNAEEVFKKLKTRNDLMQRQLENQKEKNIEKEESLAELKQEEENERNRLKALGDQVAVQYKPNILEIKSDSDSEAGELTSIQSKVISQSNSIEQLASTLKSLRDELRDDISQNDSYWEDSIKCPQDSTISSTTQEMSDKETQTLNTQKSHDRGMKYTVFFTIPFALTGVSLTIIPLIKSTENDTIFLSVGLSFSVLAIVCLVAVTLYNHYSEPIAGLALPKELNDNSLGIIAQDYTIN
ncbi:hypothetical protein [Candidatus Mesenet endosymbiont of Agriotes lineatus]|uniref:hypothetical protein n=1 Tax=Candidatus Mesenet endosymbiont of Agriotes lineatus TaxID=3077948 RepID=UPI0030D6174D